MSVTALDRWAVVGCVLMLCACSRPNELYDGSDAGAGSAEASGSGWTSSPAMSTGSATAGDQGAGGSTTEDSAELSTSTTSTGPGQAETSDCTPQSWFPDMDGDGFGDPDGELEACAPPDGDHVGNGDDCDDDAIAVNPGADELCNGIDDDCDELVDEGSVANALCEGCQLLPAADGLRWFGVCASLATWADGAEACRARFGEQANLAIIEDPVDQAALLPLVFEDHWIGMSDLGRTNVWRWHDDTVNRMGAMQIGFNGWAVNQPGVTLDEHCVELDPLQGGWADSPCEQMQPLVCEHS